MNSLGWVKALLASTGKRVAMTVVPLAAAVLSAHAGTLAPTTFGGSCNGDGYTPGTDTSVSHGVEFTGTISCLADTILFGASGGTASVDKGDSILVSWNFDINAPSGTSVDWTLEVIGYSANGKTVLDELITGADTVNRKGNTSFKDDETIGPVLGKKMVSYSVTLEFDFSEPPPGDPTVTIKSLKLRDPPDASVPEPSALFLAVPGLGLLLLKRRKSAPRT
jgi:hypothetical protein